MALLFVQIFLLLPLCSFHVLLIIVYLKAGLHFLLDAENLAKSQYPEGPETDHLISGFSWFPWVLKQMLGWFPTVPSCHYILHM